jgi:hypothetical protein
MSDDDDHFTCPNAILWSDSSRPAWFKHITPLQFAQMHGQEECIRLLEPVTNSKRKQSANRPPANRVQAEGSSASSEVDDLRSSNGAQALDTLRSELQKVKAELKQEKRESLRMRKQLAKVMKALALETEEDDAL